MISKERSNITGQSTTSAEKYDSQSCRARASAVLIAICRARELQRFCFLAPTAPAETAKKFESIFH